MNDQIGPYQIIREVGRGGMGVVQLARDTRLDRDVAIKELPEIFAQDAVRSARFDLEAKALAALSHVNLAGIYGVEEQDGAKYLVLEYVEGETLADRLDRGPLPLDEALGVAIQIAAGVEAAHEAGIVHRDLKPANIKLTPEGVAKVLDFGQEADHGRLHRDLPHPTGAAGPWPSWSRRRGSTNIGTAGCWRRTPVCARR